MQRLPTVREVGRLALPLGSRLVAGDIGLERVTRYARTGGALSPLFPTLNAEEVALVDLPLVQGSNPSLTPARVVRELSRLRVAAVVVRGEVDTGTLREAERTSTPLFVLPPSAEIPRVSRAIIRLIEDREAQEEAQAGALYRLLSQQVVAEEGLRDLARTLHEVTGHAVVVTTAGGDILAAAGTSRPGTEERSAPIVVADALVGVLALRDAPGIFDRFTEMALEQGAAAATLALARMEAVEAARSGVQLEFLAALLRGEADHVLTARARAAEFALDGLHWVILGAAEAPDALAMWQRRVAAHAEDAGWTVHATGEGPGGARPQALLVLSGGGAWGHPHRALLQALRDRWTGDAPLSLAAGEPAHGLAGLQKSLAEAQDALALGRRLSPDAGGDYLHREMGVYRLLRHLQGTADLDDFLNGTLGALDAYDREHGAELMATLGVLLSHGGNVSATARAMHLHRNSVIYRVERIRDVSGLDPTDAEDAFVLRLASMVAPLA